MNFVEFEVETLVEDLKQHFISMQVSCKRLVQDTFKVFFLKGLKAEIRVELKLHSTVIDGDDGRSSDD